MARPRRGAVVQTLDASNDETVHLPKPKVSMPSLILNRAGGSGRDSLTIQMPEQVKTPDRADSAALDENMETDDDQTHVSDSLQGSSQRSEKLHPEASGMGVDRVHISDTMEGSFQPCEESQTENVEGGVDEQENNGEESLFVGDDDGSLRGETDDDQDILTEFLDLEQKYEELKGSGSMNAEDELELDAEKSILIQKLIKKKKEGRLNDREKLVMKSRDITPEPDELRKARNNAQAWRTLLDEDLDHPKKNPTVQQHSKSKKRKATQEISGLKQKTLFGSDHIVKKARTAKSKFNKTHYLGDGVIRNKDRVQTKTNSGYLPAGHGGKDTHIVKVKITARDTADAASGPSASSQASNISSPPAAQYPKGLKQTKILGYLGGSTPSEGNQRRTSNVKLTPKMKQMLTQHVESCVRTNKEEKRQLEANRRRFTKGRRPKLVQKTMESKQLWKVPGMRTPLKNHQLNGVGWMRNRETSNHEPQGGFLADEMGLGKTIQVIADIVDGRLFKKYRKKERQTTLIICPVSLVKHWQEELKKHVDPADPLTWMVYSRKMARTSNLQISQLGMKDVVITTYPEIRKSWPGKQEVPKKLNGEAKEAWLKKQFEAECGQLHHFHFHRIILDEAQEIKNEETEIYKACKSLKAKHRWLLTGTPLSDKILELYPYLKFLHAPFTATLPIFKRNYCNKRDEQCFKRLKYIFQTFMLRRTHADRLFGERILELPDALQTTIWLDLDGPDLEVYKIVLDKYAKLIQESADSEEDSGLVLKLIMLLRRILSHPLCIQEEFESFDEETRIRIRKAYNKPADDAKVFPNNIINMRRKIFGEPEDTKVNPGREFGRKVNFQRYINALKKPKAAGPTEILVTCAKCNRNPKGPQSGECGHVLCAGCLFFLKNTAEKSEEDTFCPKCHKVLCGLKPATAVELAPTVQKDANIDKREKTSSWIEADTDGVLPSMKTLAAKQAILKRICKIEGWTFLNGNMSPEARAKVVEKFNSDKSIRVLLAMLKTGGTGLNLTAANRVLLMESWWNDATEKQASARVSRIGQTEKVEVVRIHFRSTIDQRMFEIKEMKSESIDQLMSYEEKPLETAAALEIFRPDRADGGLPFIFCDDTKVPDRWLSDTGNPDDEDEYNSEDECDDTSDTSDEE
ncbi:nima interactive protein [Venturia nashicola]|uniref:Nima interactive protein n=1 Tax=Venturia nashicola TaxID=86259 RepID=A0A4Z1PQ94_9PEZI|nr:nima interactive protein [Venturia nashicola]